MQYYNKNRAFLNEQDEDINIDGKFTNGYDRQSLSPDDQGKIAHKRDIYLPPITKKKQDYKNQLKTQQFIREILISDDKPMQFLKVQQTPKRKDRSSKNTKIVRSDLIDIRKKQKKGCGSMKCKICTSGDKNKSHRTLKKKRALTLPDYEENEYAERIVVSKALEDHRKQKRKRVIHEEELNEDGVFKLIPKQKITSSTRKIQNYQDQEDLGRTYYQQMNINGKVYLVKKKKKRMSDLRRSIIQIHPKSYSRRSPQKILYFSQAQQKDQANQNQGYYRLKTESRVIQPKYKQYQIIQDNSQQQREREELKRKKKVERELKKKQEQRIIREELNDKCRKYIHQQTYYQNKQKKEKFKEQLSSPQRMKLNRDEYQESDVEKVNIFSRNSFIDGLKFKSRRDEQEEYEEFRRKKRINEQQNQEKYSIKFPQVTEINQSIKNYQPLMKNFDLVVIKKSPNYIRQYSEAPGKQFLYFGEFDNSRKLKEGKGVLCTKKRVLEGKWKNGEIVQGAELKQNGIYRGTFLHGKKHGEGSYEWVNGQKYIGEWKDGKRHGRGQWTSKKRDIYVGEWTEGKATGQGQFITNDEGTYRGAFKNFIKHGYGKHHLPNGDIYIGDFWEGDPSGQGKYIWNNGLVYEGNFNDAVREGKGRLFKQNVFEIDGDFKNDLPHGICRCRLANGDIYTGKYSYGDRSGYGNYEEEEVKNSRIIPISYWSSNSIVTKKEEGYHDKKVG